MEINVRLEEEKDYQRVEELTRAAFGYPDRIMRGQIGCPYEHWMVHELRNQDVIMAQFCFWKTGVLSPVWVQGSGSFGIADAEGDNYPAFMAMELKEGYLKEVCGGRYFESDIYDDERNRETVRAFDRQFTNG